MRSLNKVILFGHIGADPELRESRNGRTYTRLSLATNRHWRDADDKVKEQMEWHSVMVWGQQAKVCAKHLHKGSAIFVEGALSPYSVAKENGEKEYKLTVQAHKVSFFKENTRVESLLDEDDILNSLAV